MRPTRVAYRYARSLHRLAVETNTTDKIFEDMNVISDSIAENRDLEIMLKSPIVKSDKKAKILGLIFNDKVSNVTSEFMSILVRKKREGILEVIADEYEKLHKKENHITVAEVRSARKLDEQMRKEVMAIVQKMDDNKIELKEIIDPDLIGGFIIKVGDKQVDASVLRKFKDYRRSFSKNPYVADI